ncbi:hypothetical protein HYFRA_00010808 [Hymenoscyphus fraxineus]|uniref:Uncharacterized protein n=1 Tax=Hymenoscyphus fraxineus TaxID=746836 RepID=A0A9N9PX82_9HELO|nr:hypothetical protein HYFRA_00010808 [Hymenoscyphus fraxineus]
MSLEASSTALKVKLVGRSGHGWPARQKIGYFAIKNPRDLGWVGSESSRSKARRPGGGAESSKFDVETSFNVSCRLFDTVEEIDEKNPLGEVDDDWEGDSDA